MMHFDDPAAEREYAYWCAQIKELDVPSVDGIVSVHDVLRAHFLLADYFSAIGEGLGGVGPRDLNLLHSAVLRQVAGYGGHRKWTTPHDVCATLFFGLVKNHPFHDANKRTGLLAALYHLHINGRAPTIFQRDLEQLTLAVAEDTLDQYSGFARFAEHTDPEVAFLGWYLRRSTREIDKNHYIVTYRELDRVLHRFEARLANPDRNTIDVMMMVEERHGFFANKRRKVEKRVLNIGFPDWNTEVARKDLKKIREATGLVPERGYDSQVLFKDADPLHGLIASYSPLLKRLADR